MEKVETSYIAAENVKYHLFKKQFGSSSKDPEMKTCTHRNLSTNIHRKMNIIAQKRKQFSVHQVMNK